MAGNGEVNPNCNANNKRALSNDDTESEILSSKKRLDDASLAQKDKGLKQDDKEFVLSQIENRYGEGHVGPFEMVIAKIVDNLEKGIGKFALGKLMCKKLGSAMRSGYDLKKLGVNKFKIFFYDFNDANTCVAKINSGSLNFINPQGQVLAEWKTYIPSFRIVKAMVLRGIEEPNVTEDEIMNDLEPHPNFTKIFIKPFKVERIKSKRWKDDGSSELVDTNIFKAYFKAHQIPDKMLLYKAIVNLTP